MLRMVSTSIYTYGGDTQSWTHLYKAAETVLALTVLELRLHQATCMACADQELESCISLWEAPRYSPDGNDNSTVRIA